MTGGETADIAAGGTTADQGESADVIGGQSGRYTYNTDAHTHTKDVLKIQWNLISTMYIGGLGCPVD